MFILLDASHVEISRETRMILFYDFSTRVSFIHVVVVPLPPPLLILTLRGGQ